MNYLFLVKLAGFIIILIIFSVRIEHRLTHIEVDIGWIKKLISDMNCNSNLKDKEQEK